MKRVFYGMKIFCQLLFIPFDALRELANYNWWLSNIMAWLFTAIGICAFTYWMIQLKNLMTTMRKT
ncbi:MAG: hypothetical protein CM15mP121_0670 [Bacteroidota bacterium]|nr:MAG: hypothetical protein CM15mP121_0670 [Bacteroidota bacterium]